MGLRALGGPAAFWGLLAYWAFLRADREGANASPWRIGALAAWLVALGAKEMTATVPILLVMTDAHCLVVRRASGALDGYSGGTAHTRAWGSHISRSAGVFSASSAPLGHISTSTGLR